MIETTKTLAKEKKGNEATGCLKAMDCGWAGTNTIYLQPATAWTFTRVSHPYDSQSTRNVPSYEFGLSERHGRGTAHS